MKDSRFNFLKIVLMGSILDPDLITTTLGVQPTAYYKKGYQKLVGNKLSEPRPAGMWSYKIKLLTSFEDELRALLEMFRASNVKALEGVDRATLHVYLGLSNDDSVIENTFECVFEPESLAIINRMGLEVRLTVN